VSVAEREEERSFLRTRKTLRCEKMDDSFFPPPRRTLSRSPPSANCATALGDATAAVIVQRNGNTGTVRRGRRRRKSKVAWMVVAIRVERSWAAL